ncbi:MAG: PLxRFG domain-containing protein [Comamonas sp.]|nr:PLxRFG domain-containing protein [Comamonas sp.]
MVSTLLAVASMLGGDEDEPFDAQAALQNMLADTFGQKPAEVLSHGLSRLTPWDVSGRVGLDNLIIPDLQEGLEGQRLAESAMAATLGPVAGIGVNVLRGVQSMAEGEYLRGLEAMMPSFLRNPLKSLRYANEGVQDRSGISIKDDVDYAALVGQFAGFSPSEVRLAYEGKAAINKQDRALAGRRSTLMEQFALAAMAGDEEGKAEARVAIDRFNEKNPSRTIKPMQLAQSVRMRQRRIDQAQDGVYLAKNRRDAMGAGRFASVEDDED